MKIFWREHVPLLLFYSVQAVLVPLLYWLIGIAFPFTILLYGVLLSMTVLLLYLGYRYLSHRHFYQMLSEPSTFEKKGSQLTGRKGETPLAEALDDLLQRQYQQSLEELHKVKGRTAQHITFINRWVHQMKTPVSVIQLSVGELEETVGDNIQEELDRIKKGLEMVLYTSRLEQFEHDFTIESVGLRNVVNQAVTENRKLFIRKGIQPDIRVDEGLTVFSDKKWLLFVLGQLITNAVNYSPGDGKKVSFAAFSLGEDLRLTVSDEGIGIAKEDLRRVFNPYFTGERGRQYTESTGMGLYLVREVCERLSLGVHIDSELGKGTTVELIFPREAANVH